MNTRAKNLTNDALQRLIQGLNEGQSEALRNYLRTMAKFYKYSWFNSILIWMQKPDATRVAGFRKWPEFGRHVKEGESKIRCSTQERSYILQNALGVLGLIDGHKNSHIGLLAG